jgi:predicted phage terminase large subunit-like protein
VKPTDRRQIAALQDELITRKAMQSLRLFVEWLWPVLEPRTLFLPNWHIDLTCEYLEAVTAGEIRRLVINVPPRSMKSILVSILWPLWEWIRQPAGRWLFVSYSEVLANRHALDRRRLIRHPSFQHRWGETVQLTRDQATKLEIHNTRGGIMRATSIDGSVTGMGGNRIVIDDPHNPTQAESDLQRAHAVDFYTQTLSTRLDDPQRDAIILVMQRLHTRDLAAICLEEGFRHLCLPALAPTRTMIEFPRSGLLKVRTAGEPLWPAREDAAQLEQRRRTLGEYGFAGQYQQEPVPHAGGVFHREWWRYAEPPAEFDEIIQSWDLTFTADEGADYVVGLVAGRVGALVYVLDRFKAKVSFVDTIAAIRQMCAKYPTTRAVLIEDAANGAAAVDVLRREIPGIIAVRPEGAKEARAQAVSPQVEAGQVILPPPRFSDGRLIPGRDWVEDLVDVCALFPKGPHDDDVDAISQLLLRCRARPSNVVSDGEVIQLVTNRLREAAGEEPLPIRSTPPRRPARLVYFSDPQERDGDEREEREEDAPAHRPSYGLPDPYTGRRRRW